MTRVPVDTLAREVRDLLRVHMPRLKGDNLIVVLARMSAFEHSEIAPHERQPDPLTPAQFRAMTRQIELEDDRLAQDLEDEVAALVGALDEADSRTRACDAPRNPQQVAALAQPLVRSRKSPGKKRRFRGVWDRLRKYVAENPGAEPKTVYEALKRQYGGEFIAYTNFRQNYWIKL